MFSHSTPEDKFKSSFGSLISPPLYIRNKSGCITITSNCSSNKYRALLLFIHYTDSPASLLAWVLTEMPELSAPNSEPNQCYRDHTPQVWTWGDLGLGLGPNLNPTGLWEGEETI